MYNIFGGGMISSFIKRGKIQDVNADIEEIYSSLTVLNKELEDIDMHLPTGISDTISDSAFDIWFDNIFTDIRVQGEIKDTLYELKDFRRDIISLIERLNAEIKQYQ